MWSDLLDSRSSGRDHLLEETGLDADVDAWLGFDM